MDSTSHPLLYFPILVVVVALSAIGSANASIHIYGRDPFREVGNALLLSGGSEGILASRTTSRSIHSAADDGRSYIQTTGTHNLFFISCDTKLKGLTISGKTSWKNPDGYLPGRMAPLMKFYVIMSLACAFLSLFWLSQYVRFWKEILQFQHCITVIALGLFEMSLWYFEYAHLMKREQDLLESRLWM
ncbi:hypothetical protein LguiB_006795 [Lonicera macranthoides]